MQNTAFVTGADRGVGFALSAALLQRGWRVSAGQYMPEWHELATLSSQFPKLLHIVQLDVSSMESVQAAARTVAETTDQIDLLINNAGILQEYGELRTGLDSVAMHRTFDVNVLGVIRVVEAFLPFMDRGMRRLVFLSTDNSSIAMLRIQGRFGYCMSKTALNMAVKIMFNHLRPEGYTFRLYHPGWVRAYVLGYKNMKANMEPEEGAEKAMPILLENRDDEDRLVMIDCFGREWPF